MKNRLLFCIAYWAERFLDWAIVNANRFDLWLAKRELKQIEKTRSQLERQFNKNTFHREEKEL